MLHHLSYQDIVFEMKYDSSLRNSLKRPDSVADALSSETIKELISDITKKSAEERGEVLDNPSTIEPVEHEEDVDYLIALQSGSLKTITAERLGKLEQDEADTLKDHQDLAVRQLQMGVRLIDGSLPDKEIIASIQKIDSTIGNLLIFYDVKASGEDAKRPESRKPQLRKVHLDRSVRVALRARTQDPDVLQLPDSDVFVFLDAGRHGNTGSLIGSLKDDAEKATSLLTLGTVSRCLALVIRISFYCCVTKVIPKQHRQCTIVYSESALTTNRQLVRGFMTVDQTELMHIVMAPSASAPQTRPNKHFQGSTSGNAIMGVGASDIEWRVSVGQKRAMYGPDARTIDYDPEVSKAKLHVREDSDIEPMNYWSMPTLLYQEIVHRVQAKVVLDLTATDAFAITCLELGIPYFGLCLTTIHMESLRTRLTSLIFEKFSVEGNPLYKAKLAQTINSLNQSIISPTAITETADPKAKAKAKGKGKAKAKALAAAAAAAAAGGADGEPDKGDDDLEPEEPPSGDDL